MLGESKDSYHSDTPCLIQHCAVLPNPTILMSTIPTEKELLESACHFGHRKDKWNPKMVSSIYCVHDGIHIFDLVQTRQKLEEACEALKKMQAEGKTIIFVSTKQQSSAIIENIGKVLGQPFVTKKWMPGLLTNWETMKKRMKYYLDLQNSFKTGEVEKYTKKEQIALRKQLTKLDTALGGASSMTGLPDALFVVDAVRDRVAVKEAKKLGIPVFGICDSNADPDDFTVFIPANDDAVKSIGLILETVQNTLNGKAPKKEEVPASD
jgi:small subunit ribosomal protein S2